MFCLFIKYYSRFILDPPQPTVIWDESGLMGRIGFSHIFAQYYTQNWASAHERIKSTVR